MTTLDKILIGIAIFLLLFTITIIVIYCVFQSTPDTLVECVFGLLGGEAVITFLLWYAKRRFNLLKDNEDEDDEQIS